MSNISKLIAGFDNDKLWANTEHVHAQQVYPSTPVPVITDANEPNHQLAPRLPEGNIQPDMSRPLSPTLPISNSVNSLWADGNHASSLSSRAADTQAQTSPRPLLQDPQQSPGAAYTLPPLPGDPEIILPIWNEIIGTDNDETLEGTSLRDKIQGLAGNDIIYGRAGSDYLLGGDGNDTIWGGTGNDHIYGDAGDDKLYGEEGNDILHGGDGNDLLDGGNGEDQLYGGAGDDIYIVRSIADVVSESANQGQDWVYFDEYLRINNYTLPEHVENLLFDSTGSNMLGLIGEGNDLDNHIIGFGYQQVLKGGAGNDTLMGFYYDLDNSNVRLEGGSGNDRYVVLHQQNDEVYELANSGTDLVYAHIDYTLGEHVENLTLIDNLVDFMRAQGWWDIINLSGIFAYHTPTYLPDYSDLNGTGNHLDNIIRGNKGDNVLKGLGGNDHIYGGAGADKLYGGEGNDKLYGGDGADLVDGGKGNDWLYGDAGDDELHGHDGDDELYGHSGNDKLYGGAGNDKLNGGAGNDYMSGGLGNDQYWVHDAGDVVLEAANAGIDTVYAAIHYGLGAHVENLTLLGNGHLNGSGNVLDNIIIGNSGNNTLKGGDGNDRLSGGAGHDKLHGGNGNDRLLGGEGDGLLYGDAGHDELHGDAGADKLYGHSGNDKLYGGAGNDELYGGDGDDVLYGHSGGDRLYGGAGNDKLDGGSAGDRMVGGTGNDQYWVDNAADVVVELANEGIDTVHSTVHYGLTAHVENLNLLGSAHINGSGNALNNIINGNSGNNVLKGGIGNDTLNGGAGNDKLYGGLGKDTLTGGAGNDVFAFDTALGNGNVDTITDFGAGDKIGLSSVIFGNINTANSAFFHQGTAAADANDRIIYHKASGKLYYDTDGTGSAAAVQFAELAPNTDLNHTHFLVL